MKYIVITFSLILSLIVGFIPFLISFLFAHFMDINTFTGFKKSSIESIYVTIMVFSSMVGFISIVGLPILTIEKLIKKYEK